jgi:hypothetical protein
LQLLQQALPVMQEAATLDTPGPMGSSHSILSPIIRRVATSAMALVNGMGKTLAGILQTIVMVVAPIRIAITVNNKTVKFASS